MEGWSKLQTSLAGLNIGQSANKFTKGFASSVQATRERLGQVAPDEITELPQGTATHICSFVSYSDSSVLRVQTPRDTSRSPQDCPLDGVEVRTPRRPAVSPAFSGFLTQLPTGSRKHMRLKHTTTLPRSKRPSPSLALISAVVSPTLLRTTSKEPTFQHLRQLLHPWLNTRRFLMR